MTFSIPVAVWALGIAAVTALVLAWYVLLNRNNSAAMPVLWTIVSLFVWIVAYGVEIAVESKSAMLFWANIQFFGIGAAPLLWYKTTLILVGRKPPKIGHLSALAVVPIVTVTLAFTDPLHGLFRTNPEVVRMADMVLLHADYGWWHNAVFVPYQYALYGTALIVIVVEWTHASRAYRGRYPPLAAAMILPMVGATLYALQIPPFFAFNPTSILVLISFILFFWVVKRHRAIDLVPVARERVIDTLSESIIIIDVAGRAVDVNPAAVRLFPELAPERMGRSFSELMATYPEMVMLGQGIQNEEIGFQIERGDRTRYYMARPAEILGLGGARIGTTITVADITSRVRLIQGGQKGEEGKKMRSPRAFMEHARGELKRAHRLKQSIGVAVIQGIYREHQETELAQRFEEALGEYDVATHLGSGRYAVISPEPGELDRRVNDIKASIDKLLPQVKSATAASTEATQPEELIHLAIARLR